MLPQSSISAGAFYGLSAPDAAPRNPETFSALSHGPRLKAGVTKV